MGAVTQSLITVELGNGGWARQVLDVLEHDGAAWLVTGWVLAADGRTRRPVRLVSLAMADTGEQTPTAATSPASPSPNPSSPKATSPSPTPASSSSVKPLTCGCHARGTQGRTERTLDENRKIIPIIYVTKHV